MEADRVLNYIDYKVRKLLALWLGRCVVRAFSSVLISIVVFVAMFSAAVAVPQRKLSNFATFDHCSFTREDFTRVGMPDMQIAQYYYMGREIDVLHVKNKDILADSCYYRPVSNYEFRYNFTIAKYTSHGVVLSNHDFKDYIVKSFFLNWGNPVTNFSSIVLGGYSAIVVNIHFPKAPDFIEFCGTYVAGVFFYFQREGQHSPIKKYCGTEQKFIRTVL